MSPKGTGALEELVRSAQRILIVRLSSVGDVIHTLPLLSGLRELAPTAELAWVVQAPIAPLLEPAVSVIPFDRRRPLTGLRRARAEMRSFSPDVAVDLQGNTKSGLISWCSGARHRIGLQGSDCRERLNAFFTTHALPRMQAQHAVERTLEAARALGASGAPHFELAWSEDELQAAERDLEMLGLEAERPVMCLNLAHSSDVRSWPLERQIALVRDTGESGAQVLVAGGPAEEPDQPEVISALRRAENIALALGRWTLRELGAVYATLSSRSHLVVGSDSGPLHLAAACGARTLGLYGPQDPARTGPFGERAEVMRAASELPCRPCLRRACHYHRPRACLTDLSLAEVRDRVAELLSGA